jgi:hypothetical protein
VRRDPLCWERSIPSNYYSAAAVVQIILKIIDTTVGGWFGRGVLRGVLALDSGDQ